MVEFVRQLAVSAVSSAMARRDLIDVSAGCQACSSRFPSLTLRMTRLSVRMSRALSRMTLFAVVSRAGSFLVQPFMWVRM